MKSSNILVIGSLNMDWIIKVPRTPLAGETLTGEFSLAVPGGKGANQAFAASNLCGHVYMLGAVGTDEDGQTLIQTLKKAHVHTDAIAQLENNKTGLALIYVNSEGDNTIVVLPNANAKVDHAAIDAHMDLMHHSDIVLLQMEIPEETLYYAIDLAHSLGKTIILNPAPAPDTIPDHILSKIDYLTPNETELTTLSGIQADTFKNVEKACQYLIAKGVKNVITTLGPRGALLVNQERTAHFEGFPAHAIDTTAAGDSFNGAIATYLSQGKTIDEAITFGNKVASITVTRVGAQSSIPSLEEVLNH